MSGLLRTLAPRRPRPAELMKALNDALVERKVEARYVTLGIFLWDPATRRIVMANAGALPPMICRGTEILKVRVEGVPLGLLDAREYEEVTFQAEAGDTIVLYSDGITDHVNTAGTEFGRGRLAQVVRAHCGGTADGLIGEIFAELDKFSKVAFDDQTLFVMKVQ
jgi:sigma-B regulation protein RsbU (phosphoserine phosphatase)